MLVPAGKVYFPLILLDNGKKCVEYFGQRDEIGGRIEVSDYKKNKHLPDMFMQANFQLKFENCGMAIPEILRIRCSGIFRSH